MEELDEETGKTKAELEKREIVATTVDNEGNEYIIKRDRKIYKKDGENLTEVFDEKKKLELMNNFKVTKTDVIRGEEVER